MNSDLTRTVEPGNILVSPEQPRIRIQVDEALRYAGGIAFALAGVAWAEIHYFVEPDAENRIRRRLLIQFEHFLPDNQKTYSAALPDTILLGAHEWMHNPGGYAIQAVFDARPDSDMVAGYTFLKQRGYLLPDEVLFRRFLRVIGDDRRAEIIMVYSENAALADGGGAHYAPDGMLDRALDSFHILEG